MSFREELENVLKKKALGFSYTEETVECETAKPKPFVFCERNNRVYLKNGYIMVKKRTKSGEICGLEHKNARKIVVDKNILNRLLAFKIKGL